MAKRLFSLEKPLNISCEGLKTLDQMKDRVKEQLNQPAKTPTWTAGQVRIPSRKE